MTAPLWFGPVLKPGSGMERDMAVRVRHIATLEVYCDGELSCELLIKLDSFQLSRRKRRRTWQLVSAFQGIARAARCEIAVLEAENRQPEPRQRFTRWQDAFPRHVKIEGQL